MESSTGILHNNNDDPAPATAIPIPRSASAHIKPDTLRYFQSSLDSSPIPLPPRISHVDSGYTTSSSSFAAPATHEGNHDGSAPETDIKSVPLPGHADLRMFRTTAHPVSTARFREIAPEMERLLQKHMQKGLALLFQSSKAKARKQMTMAIKLMTVGETIDDAKPAIVIFVHGDQTSNLQSMLKQPLVKQLCQPDDGITPSFDVVIVGESPRKRALLQDVSVTWDSSQKGGLVTYCGVQIHLEAMGQGSVASTLGGVVKLAYASGNFMFVGMTAGHILEGLLEEAESEELATNEAEAIHVQEGFSKYTYRRLMGKLIYPPTEQAVDEDDLEDLLPTRDWALFEMNSSNNNKIKPNLLPVMQEREGLNRIADIRRRNNGYGMTTAPPESFPQTEPTPVVMISKAHTQSVMLGELSHVPGKVMFNPSKGFVEAYMLTLHSGEVEDGDSGSWVVNPVSMDVYGHVVATDCTGDAYVIPLHGTFDEMKTVLGAGSVELPTTADLLNLALQTETGGSIGGSKISDNDGRHERMVHCYPDERHMSEMLSLCEGTHPDAYLRLSALGDCDSGYGSVGTPRFVCADDEAEGREVGESVGSNS
ncbi:hypothetical protein B0T17DRAFT_350785 [Bombardia bombarda]|uniref:Uncharacterized protein n=1 Tax=Bombardia bombarda TaxID=252184 RepID=A0AA40BW31_9PEZI|nr:hypothetical protein B0T17DRAFT_350785 [Bombardia bombarda]